MSYKDHMKKPNPNKNSISIFFKKVKRRLSHDLEDGTKLLKSFRQSQEIINKKEIRVVGLKRSGNHAIINWIKKQQTGNVLFLNDISPRDNPYRDTYEEFIRKNKQKNLQFWQQEKSGQFSKKDTLIYSFEDHDLEQIANHRLERKHNLYFGSSEKRYDILILRDPYNMIASRLKKGLLGVKHPQKTISDFWLEYAKEFLGETEYLNHNKVCINYNLWSSDVEYRKQIALKLDLIFTDAGIGDVRREGGGSSFDSQYFAGQASQMKVLERWKHSRGQPEFEKLLANKQIAEYSRKIFGEILDK